MKLFLTTIIVLLSTTVFANVEKYALPSQVIAAEVGAADGWITLSGVCFRSQDSLAALRNCRSSLETVNLMSSDQLVITGACEQWSEKCPAGYQALLMTKALVVPAAK